MSRRWLSAPFSRPLPLFFSLFLFRTILALFCKSYFVPDEHWQSVEVAHRMVFGYGYLTWDWDNGIRSFLFPFPFAVLYRLLQLLHIDTPFTLSVFPRILMSLQLAIQDLLVLEIGGFRSLVLFLTFWSAAYFGTRTLSNSAESLLYLLLFKFQSPVVLIVLAFWIRPTSLIASVWFFNFKRDFTVRNCLLGFVSVLFLSGFDAFFYYRMRLEIPWFTPLRFLYFNFVKNYAVKFGRQPFFFYFYSCLPSLLLVLTPLVLKCLGSKHLYFVLANVAVLSLSAHKEIRYLAPILSFLAFALSDVVPNWLAVANGAIQSFVFVFLSRFHQIGQSQILGFLARDPVSSLFLLPCHSTPLTPYIHRNVTLRFLTCLPDPPSETEQFLADPRGFVDRLTERYERIVTYAQFESQLGDWLAQRNMVQTISIFNSFFFIDGINSSRIVLYESKD
jgi:phosphatidylinositol glycan class B